MLDLQDPEILRSILDNVQIGLYVTDRERKILFWNKAAEKTTGYMRHEVVGRLCAESGQLGSDKKRCAFCGPTCPSTEVMRSGKSLETPIYLQHKAGHMVLLHMRVAPIRDRRGSVIGVFEAFEEQGVIPGLPQESLAAHGCLDVLSGVPNHRFTEFHLRESLLRFAEYNLRFGILCIAIDQIDHLRDTHGKEAAVAMLHMVAQTASHILGAASFLGRWGENEFIGIVMDCDPAELERRGEELRRITSNTWIRWWDDHLSAKVLVKRAMVQPGDTIESLLERVALSPSSLSRQTAEPGQAVETSGHGDPKG